MMVWIKRNLVFLLGVVVALVVLGGAAAFTFFNYGRQAEAVQKLGTATNEFNQILNQKPFPNTENIEATRQNTEVVAQFVNGAGRVFTAKQYPRLTGQKFQIYLINALAQLQRDATNANVTIPPGYNFTFGSLLRLPNLLAYSIEPLTIKFAEVQALCRVLFEARVHALESLDRLPAYPGERADVGFMTDLVVNTNMTTEGGVVISTPYRITFRGFTTELSAVLNGLARSDTFFVVRKLDVSPSTGMGTLGTPQMSGDLNELMMMMMSSGTPGGIPPGTPGAPGMVPGMVRPAVRSPYPNRNPVAPQAPALKTILNEKPLRITMVVDVVKLVPVAAPPTGP